MWCIICKSRYFQFVLLVVTDLSISSWLFSQPHNWYRVKGGKKGRPRKSQTSEDGVSTENDSISTEGESGYLDGTTQSSSFDAVPNSIGNTDSSIDHQGPMNESGSLSGSVPSTVYDDPSVDGYSKEMDNLVPDGSNTAGKIKKPRRSEEYLIIISMLEHDICMLTAWLATWLDRKFPARLMTLHFRSIFI